MLNELASTVDQFIYISKVNFPLVVKILGCLFAIHIVNWGLRYRLNLLGIYPRHLLGLPGIAFSPLLHGNFNHLFYNSVPLFFLLTFLLYYGMDHFILTTIFITVVSGGAVWLLARPGIHIGASSVIMGYFATLLVYAYQHPGMITILIALLTLYYLSGLFFNLLPGGKGVSWEGHVFGFIAGVLAAVFL